LVADQDWGVCPKCGGQYEGSRFAAKEEADAQRAIQMKRERLAKKAAEEAERLKAKAEWENKTFFQKAPLRLFYGFCWLLFMVMHFWGCGRLAVSCGTRPLFLFLNQLKLKA
jgi:hypothetical protein